MLIIKGNDIILEFFIDNSYKYCINLIFFER